MLNRILILGASGTVGSAVFRHLSRDENSKVFGTFFSSPQKNTAQMMRFSVEAPDEICSILKRIRPNIVVSALRGSFEEQLAVHENTARYLNSNNGKIIYLSTANVFDGNCSRPHYETDNRTSASDYGRFKILCEDLLKKQLGNKAVLIRIPFVWGKNSPRMQAVKGGCESGRLDVPADFFCNHVSDVQIAQTVQWIINKDKDGTFHIGTSDVTSYQDFTERLITAMGVKRPLLVFQKHSGTMALLSSRNDIPDMLRQNSNMLIRYLCGGSDVPH